jgi:hypothetical protein
MDTRLLSIIGLLLVIFIAAMLANSSVVGYSSAKSLTEYPYEGFAEIQEKFKARDEKTQHSPAEAFGPMDEYEKKKYAEALTPMEVVNSLNPFKKDAFGPMEVVNSLNPFKKDAFGPMEVVNSLNPFKKDAFGPMEVVNSSMDVVKSLNPFKKDAFGPMNSASSLTSETPAIKVAGFNGLQSGAYGDEKIIGFMYNNDSNTTCKPFGYTNSKGNICLSEGDIKMLTTRGGNALGASDQIGK